MEPLNQQSSTFFCNSVDHECDVEFSGMLEIFVHHARNIHNICIYDNQDVYAKFSLTYNPDDMISTRVVIRGGKNPDFSEKLELKVTQIDAVLKCEIYMLSRARNFLEDQLLGFALVPISDIISHGGKINSQDFSLSSTDLFHSPAGIVQLSVSICSSNTSSVSAPLNSSKTPFQNFSGNSSISSEVILLDPNEFSRVEFPDMNAASEDQMMVSQYFNLNSNSCSVLETGDDDDYEMGGNSYNSLNRSNRSSTTTSLGDDGSIADPNSTPKKDGVVENRGKSSEVEENGLDSGHGYRNVGRVGNPADMEEDEVVMQQQIVEMYMKSMQQFTESLAKMKLPMGLDRNPDVKNPGNVIRVMEETDKLDVEKKKKDNSRVFYGSRAFF